MLYLIAKQEFIKNFLTLRFIIGFLLCEILFIASSYILTDDYESRIQRYSNAVIAEQQRLSHIKVFSQLQLNVYRRPEALSIFCEGLDRQLGNAVSIAYDEIPIAATRFYAPKTFSDVFLKISPLRALFPSIDIAIIFQVVLSILTLLFAYDTISGEKERGTLALVMSNAVPRHTVLLGKYLGGMLSICLPLTAGILSALALIQMSPSVALTGADWGRIGLMVFVAFIYISVFFSLGLLVSSLTSRSAITLIILLFIWVVWVMILPGAGAYLAKRIHPTPPMAEDSVSTAVPFFNPEYNQKLADYAQKHPMPKDHDISDRGMVHSGYWPFVYGYVLPGRSKGTMLWYAEGTKFMIKLRMEFAQRAWQAYQGYQQELARQATLAHNISRLSPAWTFYNLTSIIAGTDIDSYLGFMDETRRYRDEIVQYMRSKGGLGLGFFTPLKEKQLYSGEPLKPITFEEWKAMAPLDLSDMPRFDFTGEPISSGLRRALLDLTILVLLNILFFMGAYVSFLRQSVFVY